MKTLVVIPTYNEEDNIDKVLSTTLKVMDGDVLVIDDNSTDATKEMVRRFFDSERVYMLERPSKLGLGTAYVSGFQWGLQRDYELFFEMDADNSHNPESIPFFVEEIKKGCDIVIGSRYIKNTVSVVGWDFRRLLLSKFGNWYAAVLLGLRRLSDLTSGYRCYSRKALEAIGLEKIKSNGYAFQIEMAYRGYKKGLKIAEIPIIFYEREGGGSKLSKDIITEALLLPFKLLMDKSLN